MLARPSEEGGTYGVLDFTVGGADFFEPLVVGAWGHIAVLESECGSWYVAKGRMLATYFSEALKYICGQKEDITRELMRLVKMARRRKNRIDCYISYVLTHRTSFVRARAWDDSYAFVAYKICLQVSCTFKNRCDQNMLVGAR